MDNKILKRTTSPIVYFTIPIKQNAKKHQVSGRQDLEFDSNQYQIIVSPYLYNKITK